MLIFRLCSQNINYSIHTYTLINHLLLFTKLNHCLNQSSNHQMDSPSTPKNKRSFPNESPRTQRTCVEKKQIIDYYNSIKEIYGAKAKTVKKFELKSTSALSRILEKEQKFNELIEENRLDSSRKRIRLSAHEILEENLFKFMTNVRSNN